MAIIKHPAAPYIAPFAALILVTALGPYLPAGYLIRALVPAVFLILFSRRAVTFRIRSPRASALTGALVFLIWVTPDVLWPVYRHHWLFKNWLMSPSTISAPASMISNPWFLIVRVLGSAVIVPVVEELFWRGWLMRYLISTNFERVRMGAYTAFSFWVTAVLFASEHGPYWDVGLAAGIVYNFCMIRTRSLGDCILAHAVTNACLAAYVIAAAQWRFWL